jgi:hypothetical protein
MNIIQTIILAAIEGYRVSAGFSTGHMILPHPCEYPTMLS